MNKEEILRRVVRRLPGNLGPMAKGVYYRDRARNHPALKKFGTVQDLYYWVAEGNLDTLLLLQNYFSVLYPTLRTETEGSTSLYSNDGELLGQNRFSLAQYGSAKLRVSSLLEQLQVSPDVTFGTLECDIAIPRDVLAHVQSQKAIYFWDRFYIGYINGAGQTCFVHGIEYTSIYRDGRSNSVRWNKKPEDYQWAPETPVNIEDHKKFSVIMINRTTRATDVTLVLSDSKDDSLSWSAKIAPSGVHRFELTRDNTNGLTPTEMRMRVKGMPTRFGRPVVFKEFHNGAISAMHC